MVEGAATASTSRHSRVGWQDATEVYEAAAPSTVLRTVPLPRFAGEDVRSNVPSEPESSTRARPSSMPTLSCTVESFPIAGRFVIARGAKTEARVVVATIADGHVDGRGECVPYARYDESIEGVVAAIESVRAAIEAGADRARLLELLPPGAARNALDCALWDLEAKATGVPAHVRAGVARPPPVTTAYTISVDTPEAMAQAAARAADRPLLKVKLAGGATARASPRCARRRRPRPLSSTPTNPGRRPISRRCSLPAPRPGSRSSSSRCPPNADAALAEVAHPVPICADESVHGLDGLAALRGRYDAVNIKLDKTGGLTAALAVAAEAERLGFAIMVGCMVGSSLAMAPALLLAGRARFVDLDGPLLLARDRPEGLRFEGSTLMPAGPELWG